jgi:hypothetical protein
MKEIKPKLIEFIWGNCYHSYFTNISITPNIQVIKDNQNKEVWEEKDFGKIYLGYIMYSIIFEWLGFYFEIQLNKIIK